MELQLSLLCLLVVVLHRGRTTAARFYTAAEVAKHNTPQDFWVIIHNKIYDLTSFLIEHPGGEEVLLELGGTDGSDAFEDVGHSVDTRVFMEKLLVGELRKSDDENGRLVISTAYVNGQDFSCVIKKSYQMCR